MGDLERAHPKLAWERPLMAASDFGVPMKPVKSSTKRTINTIYHDNAAQLLSLGYSPIPLSEKQPRIAGWQNKFCDASRPSLEAALGEYSNRHRGGFSFDGIGVASYGGLVTIDVDSDDPAVLHRLSAIVPGFDSAPACIGQRGIKAFFRSATARTIPR